MCLLVVQYRTLAAAPLLIASNREEFFDRPALPPAIQPGSPRVLCGIDTRAGGTWLGVNEHGLVVGVTNRLKGNLPAEPRSRGTLCRELLNCRSAEEAVEQAVAELKTDRYAGANFLCVDARSGAFIQGSDTVEVLPLSPGVHILTNGTPNDPTDTRQTYVRGLLAMQFPNSIPRFVEVARSILSQGVDATGRHTVILRGPDRGTVSSTILALGRNPAESIYHYAPGPPDEHPYEDFSQQLHKVLGTRASDDLHDPL